MVIPHSIIHYEYILNKTSFQHLKALRITFILKRQVIFCLSRTYISDYKEIENIRLIADALQTDVMEALLKTFYEDFDSITDESKRLQIVVIIVRQKKKTNR